MEEEPNDPNSRIRWAAMPGDFVVKAFGKVLVFKPAYFHDHFTVAGKPAAKGKEGEDKEPLEEIPETKEGLDDNPAGQQ